MLILFSNGYFAKLRAQLALEFVHKHRGCLMELMDRARLDLISRSRMFAEVSGTSPRATGRTARGDAVARSVACVQTHEQPMQPRNQTNKSPKAVDVRQRRSRRTSDDNFIDACVMSVQTAALRTVKFALPSFYAV